MAEQEKKSYKEMFNKKERLKVIKQGILNYLNRVRESQREKIAIKLYNLQIDENPYEVFYRGGESRKVLVHPTNEEINYCLNFLKGKGLIIYNEKLKRWIIKGEEGTRKKGQTLDEFFKD
ncbi:MAG: hypothetical protein ACFFD2_03640 [Promethearchaeota archaeon]